jgi:hypothetical protein
MSKTRKVKEEEAAIRRFYRMAGPVAEDDLPTNLPSNIDPIRFKITITLHGKEQSLREQILNILDLESSSSIRIRDLHRVGNEYQSITLECDDEELSLFLHNIKVIFRKAGIQSNKLDITLEKIDLNPDISSWTNMPVDSIITRNLPHWMEILNDLHPQDIIPVSNGAGLDHPEFHWLEAMRIIHNFQRVFITGDLSIIQRSINYIHNLLQECDRTMQSYIAELTTELVTKIPSVYRNPMNEGVLINIMLTSMQKDFDVHVPFLLAKMDDYSDIIKDLGVSTGQHISLRDHFLLSCVRSHVFDYNLPSSWKQEQLHSRGLIKEVVLPAFLLHSKITSNGFIQVGKLLFIK